MSAILNSKRSRQTDWLKSPRGKNRWTFSAADIDAKLEIDLMTLEHQQSLALSEHQKDIAIAQSTKGQIKALSEMEVEKKKLVKAEEDVVKHAFPRARRAY